MKGQRVRPSEVQVISIEAVAKGTAPVPWICDLSLRFFNLRDFRPRGKIRRPFPGTVRVLRDQVFTPCRGKVTNMEGKDKIRAKFGVRQCVIHRAVCRKRGKGFHKDTSTQGNETREETEMVRRQEEG